MRKRLTDGGARLSVLKYLDELHGAAARLFGQEATVRDCCVGDVVATMRIDPDVTRPVELPPATPFAASNTVADPHARRTTRQPGEGTSNMNSSQEPWRATAPGVLLQNSPRTAVPRCTSTETSVWPACFRPRCRKQR